MVKVQKLRFVKLVDMLRKYSDEDNPLTTSEICERLNSMGVKCDRRTLSDDIKLLNDNGYEIMSLPVGRAKGYYISDRCFSLPELKILIDAVQAAGFITPTKTDKLINKLAELAGIKGEEMLKENRICFNTRKHSNEQIFYNVDRIQNAIAEQKMISFYYFDINEYNEIVYRYDKLLYKAEPIVLVYNEDNYYLTAYYDKYKKPCNFRLDRMESVNVLDEEISKEILALKNKADKYTKEVFKMYGGEYTEIILRLKRKLIGILRDKFGSEVTVYPDDEEGYIIARTEVQVSPTFWGWIFQFVGEMDIISPPDIANEYRERARQVLA